MGIRFACSHCQSALNVKSHQAGKRGRCPKCGHKIQIPVQSTMAAAKAATEPENNTSQFSKTQVFGHNQADDPSEEQDVAIKKKLDDFSVRDDETNNNASDDSISLAPSELSDSDGPDSFMLGKPTNHYVSNGALNPVDDAPQKIWYIRHPEHSEVGPVKGTQLREMLDAGEVRIGSFVWREDWDDWEKVGDVFPALATPLPHEAPDPADASEESNASRSSIWHSPLKTPALIIVGVAIVGLLIYLTILALQ